MKDWKADLEEFFQLHEQQESQQQHNQAQPRKRAAAIEEFMVAVATPAFEEFSVVLKEHGRHIWLHLGDSYIRIVSEFAGREEFDYTLWTGTSDLSGELRASGRRIPDSFRNARGTSAIADTTKDDITQQLAGRYIEHAARAFA